MGVAHEDDAGRPHDHGKNKPVASGEESPTRRMSPRDRIDMSRVKIADARKWLARRLERELGVAKDVPIEPCIAILERSSFLEPKALEDSLSEFIPTAPAVTADLWDYLTCLVAGSTSPNAQEERVDVSNGKLSEGCDKAGSSESLVAGQQQDRKTASKPAAESDKADAIKDTSEGLDAEMNPNEKENEHRKNGAVFAPQRNSVDTPSHQNNQIQPNDVGDGQDAMKDPTDREKLLENNLADADAPPEGSDSASHQSNQIQPNDVDDGQYAMKDPKGGEKPPEKDRTEADAPAEGYDSPSHQGNQSHPKDTGDGHVAMKHPKGGEKPREKNLADEDDPADDYDLREAVLSRSGKPLKGKSDELTADVESHSQRRSRTFSDRDDSRERRRGRRRRRREYDDEDEREHRRHRRRHKHRSRSISRSPSPRRSPSEEQERERRREKRRARRRERELSREERRRTRKRQYEDDVSQEKDDHNLDNGGKDLRKQRSKRDDDESDDRRSRRKRRRHDDREDDDKESADDFESERYRERRRHRRDRSRRGDRDDEDRQHKRVYDSREDRYTSGHRHDRYYDEEREHHRSALVPRRDDHGRYETPGYDDRRIRSDRHGNGLRMDDGSFRHVSADSDGLRGEDPRQSRLRYNDERLGDQRDSRRRESLLRRSAEFHRGPVQYDSGRHERTPAQTGLSKNTDREESDRVGTSRMYEPQSTSTPWNAAADVEVSGRAKPSVKARVQKKTTTLKLDRLRSKALASMGKKTTCTAKEDEKTMWDPKN